MAKERRVGHLSILWGCTLFKGECSYCLLQLLYFYSVQSICQITQHKWAEPFMEPVDVKGLGLHDYYEVKALNFLVGVLIVSMMFLGILCSFSFC